MIWAAIISVMISILWGYVIGFTLGSLMKGKHNIWIAATMFLVFAASAVLIAVYVFPFLLDIIQGAVRIGEVL